MRMLLNSLIALVGLAQFALAADDTPTEKQPNIIIIFADDKC